MSLSVESSWVGSVARRFGNFDIGDAYSPRNWELPDLVKNVEALIRVDLRPNVRRYPLPLLSPSWFNDLPGLGTQMRERRSTTDPCQSAQ